MAKKAGTACYDTPLDELDSGDLHCPSCKRDWYWTDFDDERTLGIPARQKSLQKAVLDTLLRYLELAKGGRAAVTTTCLNRISMP